MKSPMKSPMKRPRSLPLALLCAAAGLAACHSSAPSDPTTSKTAPSGSSDATATSTVEATPGATPAPAPFTAKPQSALPNLPPGAAVPAGEVEAPCPYLSKADAQQTQGTHIYRVTVSKATPARCRFYYYAGPHNVQLEIAPAEFASPTDAHNAMVLTAQASTDPSSVSSYPDFKQGVDLISFRTSLYGPDKGRDWACVFAKGKTMVLVRTQQRDTSQDARNVANLIVGKF